MNVGVKICGLNTKAAVEAALAAGCDFAGLVLFPPSPRHLPLDSAASLADLLRGGTRIVVLLVDPADDAVVQVVQAVQPDFIQLHGNESPSRTAAIGHLAKRPIIKAIGLADAADVAKGHAYEDAADYLLFDAKPPTGATRPGGYGAAFDWQLLGGARFKRPHGVAGGLTAENVARAIRIAHPAFVDASSGVEDAPGRKSPGKIAAFAAAVRNDPYKDLMTGSV